MAGFSIVHWFIIVIVLFLIVVPYWRIVSKMGFPGALSLLFFVPLLNLILLWVLAFVTWPIEKGMEQQKP
jgi:hypothetical protein